MKPETKVKQHGGKREGAGRNPARFPAFLKKFRATEDEQEEFHAMMTGDAREDFSLVLDALKYLTLECKRKAGAE